MRAFATAKFYYYVSHISSTNGRLLACGPASEWSATASDTGLEEFSLRFYSTVLVEVSLTSRLIMGMMTRMETVPWVAPGYLSEDYKHRGPLQPCGQLCQYQ